MDTHLIQGIAAIVLLGVGAQWLAWRLRFPAILLLLIAGFVAGPVIGWLKPSEMFGDLLFPIVSLSVGLILFEGGLSLKRRELQGIGSALWNLITIGAAITWFGTALAAHYVLNLSISLSLLLGAILVVTGPTVIGPLLRQVRPKGASGTLLKWEGILIDPIGASLALLVFEGILIGETQAATRETVLAILRTLLAAAVTGLGGAYLLTEMMRRYFIPDFLQNSVAIMFVVGAFSLSNQLQHESGLLAVTLMGIYLANQERTDVRHIIEFKENMRVLLISALFIVLAATLDLESIRTLSWATVVFLMLLILVIRPVSVFVATALQEMPRPQKVFVSCMAPRGIVAASVASVFGLRLQETNVAEAELLAPITFVVIAGTVAVYGLTAAPMAHFLGVAQSNPKGVLFVGAHRWARAIASALKKEGVPVMLADTNYALVSAARLEGLKAYHGNVLSDQAAEEMNLSAIGYLAALTPNDAVNSFAAMRFLDDFGRGHIYQLPYSHDEVSGRVPVAQHLRGRELFAAGLSFDRLTELFKAGATIKRVEITEGYGYANFKNEYGDRAVPLAVISGGTPKLWTVQDAPRMNKGDVLLILSAPEGQTIHPPETAAPKKSESENEETK